MKILLVTASMNVAVGGPPRVIAGSASALVRRGHAVDIIALREPGLGKGEILSAFPDLQKPRIQLQLYEPSAPRWLGGSSTMQAALRNSIAKYDAVHLHGVWELCLNQAASLARNAGVPTFVSPHGMLDRWSMRQSILKKHLALRFLGTGAMMTRANGIVYGTEDEASESQISLADHNRLIVPNGIDTEEVTVASLPRTPELTKILPQLAGWTRTVLYFSRIHPKKGLDLLVDAFLMHAPTHPGVGLLIVGIAQDRAFEAKIRARIAGSGMANRAILTTNLIGSAARVAFHHSDIFALPSHQEGFSVAILEAMALQKPLLITDRCHFPEVADRWECGLVANDNLAGVSRALGSLLKMPDAELTAMGARARQAVVKNFSWSAVAPRLEAIYAGKLR